MANCNIFDGVPADLESERFEDLIRTETVRIERILSKGHSSPESGWYDQHENEWVVVLQGSGRILFEDGTGMLLNAGDYIMIPAGKKHRVVRTDPEAVTVWLAVFYK